MTLYEFHVRLKISCLIMIRIFLQPQIWIRFSNIESRSSHYQRPYFSYPSAIWYPLSVILLHRFESCTEIQKKIKSIVLCRVADRAPVFKIRSDPDFRNMVGSGFQNMVGFDLNIKIKTPSKSNISIIISIISPYCLKVKVGQD